LKHKRFIAIAIAILFLVVLFWIKNGSQKESLVKTEAGLSYTGDETLEELVSKDTDGDKIADWEESLWGTDPLKMDTNDDGISDGEEIAKKRTTGEGNLVTIQGEENLTQTDMLAREIFSSVAGLSQAGVVDAETASAVGNSLAEGLIAPVQKKIYTQDQIKKNTDTSPSAVQAYNVSAGKVLSPNYPLVEEITKAIEGSFVNEDEINPEQLAKELNPIISKIDNAIKGLLQTPAPYQLIDAHLKLINSFEILRENLTEMKKVGEDPLAAMNAISNFLINIDDIDYTLVEMSTVIRSSFSSQ